MPVTISFTDPTPSPDGYRVGYRKKGTLDAYTYVTDPGPSPIALNDTDFYQDYEGTLESICSGFYSEAVPWETNNFSTEWTVTDVWYDCADCVGLAAFCVNFQVMLASDESVIFSYGFDPTGPVKTGYMPTLEAGVSYLLRANFSAEDMVPGSTGIDTTTLTGNSTTGSWTEGATLFVVREITFTGVAGVNTVSVSLTDVGPDPACGCT